MIAVLKAECHFIALYKGRLSADMYMHTCNTKALATWHCHAQSVFNNHDFFYLLRNTQAYSELFPVKLTIITARSHNYQCLNESSTKH